MIPKVVRQPVLADQRKESKRDRWLASTIQDWYDPAVLHDIEEMQPGTNIDRCHGMDTPEEIAYDREDYLECASVLGVAAVS